MVESNPGDDAVITVDGVSKAYGLPYVFTPGRFAKSLRHGLSAYRRSDLPLALTDIDLTVRPGELLGMIGRNGAGKSTLLKMISGVSKPTAGRVKVTRSLFPMIELNAGMNPRFTGRENIYLLATIMGISRLAIRERMPDIEEFCDLGRFFDMPVRTYSSGMPGRLGFAVAVHSDADIVLIDEVLSVGDINFRERCTEKMEELRDSGKTLVLVSHSMTAISALCSRTIVLEGGRKVYEGATASAIKYYSDLMRATALRKIQKTYDRAAIATSTKAKTAEMDIWGLEVLTLDGQLASPLPAADGFDASFCIAAKEAGSEAIVFLRLEDSEGVVLIDESEIIRTQGDARAQNKVIFSFPRGVPLKSGAYKIQMGCKDRFGQRILASMQQEVLVFSDLASEGLISSPYNLSVKELEEQPASAAG